MNGRPPLPIGAHGNIKVVPLGPKQFEARCRYRDADGETRKVKRQGRTENAATNNLQKALAERRHNAGATITPDTRVRDVAALWFEQRQAEADAGEFAPNSLGSYRSVWKLHVDPALGGLRLREISVARCEAWQQALRKRVGSSPTKTSRTVLGGILGYAARLGAIPTNPCRDLSRIPGKAKRRPRALTRDELNDWLDGMTADARALRWDIPDLTRFMLATGCRVGEALACSWDEIDFEARTVAIRWKLIRVKGQGLQRVPGTKRGADGGRTLQVPTWAVAMLMERRMSERAGWPVFPDSIGGWRDPSNTLKVLRLSREKAGFGWVTSHVFRKTHATLLDEAGLTPRQIADQLEHSDPSMTQRVYMGRGVVANGAAAALEDALTLAPAGDA